MQNLVCGVKFWNVVYPFAFPQVGYFISLECRCVRFILAHSIFVNGPSGPHRGINLSTKMVKLLNYPPDSHVLPHFLSHKLEERSHYF